MNNRYIIAGAGIAGLSAAKAIRQTDPDGIIDIFTAENNMPYSRPMLTKTPFNSFNPNDWMIYQNQWFEDNNITLHINSRLTGTDNISQTVFDGCGSYHYDKLIIACGAESFIPPIPGANSEGVFAIRRSEDIFAIKKACKASKHAVIIGGGVIGLEAASELLRYGQKVTVLESMPYLIAKQIDEEISDIICRSFPDTAIHTGVNIISVKKALGGDSGLVVNLADGRSFPCDFIIMSCGVRAQVTFAPESVKSQGAVAIDEYCRTSDENIYAAGDCAKASGMNYALWSSAMAQGKTAGLNAAADLCGTKRFTVPDFDTSLVINSPYLSLFALGDMGKNHDKEYEIKRFYSEEKDNLFFVNPAAGNYFAKVCFSDGKPVGATIVGNLSNMQTLKETIQIERPEK